MATNIKLFLILLISPFFIIEGNSWELGPFIKEDSLNPILEPRNDTTFFCPIRQEYVHFEIKDVFNPAAIVRDNKVYLLYRAEDNVGELLGTSRIGLAISSDGLNFIRDPTPIFYPANDTQLDYEWEGGCEDPRIIEDENGIYYLTYTAYNGIARLFIASSRNLRTWTKHGSIFKNIDSGAYIDLWSKAGSIVTQQIGDKFVAIRIDGKYWMYWGDTNIYVAWSIDLINWIPLTNDQIIEGGSKNLTIVFGPRLGKFDSDLVEPGPQAILTESGIFMIYNSRNKKDTEGGDPNIPEGTYSAGQILLDEQFPWLVKNRTEDYFMTPDKDYELVGQVNNVVFLEGLVNFDGKWFVYYGTADSKIAVAVADENNN